MKKIALKLHWIIASQFGLDPLRFYRSLKGLPFFLNDLRKFRKSYKGKLELKPCLHDRFMEGGVTKSEYFWQDLLVAKWINEANPEKHVDIGSRVDGFVAHVASFREIEILDVRPISSDIPGIKFIQADLMEPTNAIGENDSKDYCDSLSCLHALEHFGLGRYGDNIDAFGHDKGITNMAPLLKPGGTLYLSTPIGIERVEFNANRVFNPIEIIKLAKRNNLILESLVIINDGKFNKVSIDEANIKRFSELQYNLGIFIFKRI